jgi:hypothetical protein
MTATATCAHCGQEFDGSENGCPACGHLQQRVPCTKHPDREAHGQCVICGTIVCEDCDHGNGHHACAMHSEIPVIEGWAQVYSTNDELEANMVRDNLRSEGIDAEVLSQRDQTLRLELGDFAATVRVLVPAFDYIPAEELVSGHTDAAGEVRFACATCGEAYEAGEARCGTCQAELPPREAASAP